MGDFLQHLWQLSYESKTVDILRNEKYAIPVIQSFHLFGITLLLGGMVILNLRLSGIGLQELSMKSLGQQVWKWAIGGLLLAIVSGALVFLPDPARYAANTAFRTKMLLLCAAALFQFTIYRRTIRSDAAGARSRLNMVVACCSLTLWFLVGWAGRAIAFLG
jgi:hypothetical protein